MMTAWETLVERYADGRPLCNCGQAYADPDGPTCTTADGRVIHLGCKYGCSVNQILAREDIASRILMEAP